MSWMSEFNAIVPIILHIPSVIENIIILISIKKIISYLFSFGESSLCLWKGDDEYVCSKKETYMYNYEYICETTLFTLEFWGEFMTSLKM